MLKKWGIWRKITKLPKLNPNSAIESIVIYIWFDI
jgi:hypothetical protein